MDPNYYDYREQIHVHIDQERVLSDSVPTSLFPCNNSSNLWRSQANLFALGGDAIQGHSRPGITSINRAAVGVSEEDAMPKNWHGDGAPESVVVV